MALPTGNYHGFSRADYQIVSRFEGFNADDFTPVADGEYYVFNGNQWDWFDFVINAGEDPDEFGLHSFTYIASTQSVGGYN